MAARDTAAATAAATRRSTKTGPGPLSTLSRAVRAVAAAVIMGEAVAAGVIVHKNRIRVDTNTRPAR